MCDFDSHDTARHPDKKKTNEIWINIGTETGVNAQLTMGIGGMIEDGFYNDYVSFDMDTAKDIDDVITMLNEAKQLLAEYLEECWDIKPDKK